MIITMSPAKLFNLKVEQSSNFQQPFYNKEAKELNLLLKEYTIGEISDMMSINMQLAMETYEFIHTYDTSNCIYPAALLYNGIAYQGLDFGNLSEEGQVYGNTHLRILSGLYGMLNPLDSIKPYRLEMQTFLQNDKGGSLYDFWGDLLTNRLIEQMDELKTTIWLNLASKEYTKVINKKMLPKGTQIITPVFKECVGNNYKQIVVYVKRARGMMARFAIENEISKTDDLKKFDCEGYAFSEHLSTDKEWVFIR